DSFQGIKAIKEIDMVYFLGGIGNPHFDITELDTLNERQSSGVLSLFRLVKSALITEVARKAINLKVITNNVFKFESERIANPYAGSLLG
ncbi:hypothetical protein, partial [Salmonella sp. SAL4359]|uniref:hypothetical protein n=1 Tax=Salmonella sp. SAL4359 TaxID=3159880 RepID=UPI00397E8F64